LLGLFYGSPVSAETERKIFLLEAQGPLTPAMIE
jgi:hypothetical protein